MNENRRTIADCNNSNSLYESNELWAQLMIDFEQERNCKLFVNFFDFKLADWVGLSLD